MACTDPAILIVEADVATRELYRRELGRSYCVEACASARQAVTALQTKQIKAIVLEPATLGDDVWWFLSQLPSESDGDNAGRPPIILCSTVDERRRWSEMGAATYLIKPVVPARLLAALEKVVGELPSDMADARPIPSKSS